VCIDLEEEGLEGSKKGRTAFVFFIALHYIGRRAYYHAAQNIV
jgi:hypothetical protein